MTIRVLAGRRDAEPREDGFMLLEAIISISLIVVIMSALTTFFVTASHSTSELRGRQTASQLADSAVDRIRVLQPSDTYAGRSTHSGHYPVPDGSGRGGQLACLDDQDQ